MVMYIISSKLISAFSTIGKATAAVYLGVKTCEVFLCFVAIVKVRSFMLTSLFSFFYVTGECHRFC